MNKKLLLMFGVFLSCSFVFGQSIQNSVVASTGGSASASVSGLSEAAVFSAGSLEGGGSESIGSGAGINQQPLQAVVLESDITNTQNLINNYQTNSEIG